MAEKELGAGRVFASNYQIAICDDPAKSITDDDNWDDDAMDQGFAGGESFRMVGTEADLNDHWVELVTAETGPDLGDWERVLCLPFHSASGWVHIMSVVDTEPVISAEVGPGDYAVFVAGQNIGTDLLSLGEQQTLSDAELAARKDLEWYRIVLVPGIPAETGRIKDLE
ncbi:hypothetical protein [Pelagibius sp.]|uniref:hypothetical protein n=1 Tax=Pelagibius sp. TaxID=1931238 RepID=UPI0026244870|nr:hypothetical protein [Pelagibius sp.]